MDKNTRYLVAIFACVGIFVLWIVFQMYIAKGTFVAVIFCSAMLAAWKAITGAKDKNEYHDENSESKNEESKKGSN